MLLSKAKMNHEELSKIRDRVRNVEAENESLKQKVAELQTAGFEQYFVRLDPHHIFQSAMC